MSSYSVERQKQSRQARRLYYAFSHSAIANRGHKHATTSCKRTVRILTGAVVVARQLFMSPACTGSAWREGCAPSRSHRSVSISSWVDPTSCMSDHHLVTDWCDRVEKNIAWVLDPAVKRATHTFSAHHNVPAKQQGVWRCWSPCAERVSRK